LDATLVSIGGPLLTGIVAVVGNAIITARRAGRTEGIIQTSVKALGDRTTKIEVEQKEQWSKIGEHTADIGYLKGRVNGNGKAHHTGL
jgi:hypothetical protein